PRDRDAMTTAVTLADLLARNDARRPALILPEDGSVTTHRDLSDQIESVTAALRRTFLQPGQAVAIVLPNGMEYLVSFLTTTRARLTAAPLNPAYKADEFRFYLEDAGVRAVIAPPEERTVRQVAREMSLPVWSARRGAHGRVVLEGEGWPGLVSGSPEAPRPDDVALFLHTSGTPSRPKGVPPGRPRGVRPTPATLRASPGTPAPHSRLSPADTGLVVMPLFHVHGLVGATLAPLSVGGTVIVPPRFSASTFWPAAQTYRANWYSSAPTIHQILLTRADADGAPARPGLRFIRPRSAAPGPATLAGLEARFNAPAVLEAYAMTEASHQMTSNPLPPGAREPGTVGRGTNVEVGIMDEGGTLLPVATPGEVVVRGPNVTRGYHNNPEANAVSFTGGWFRTGDRGVLDADGYLTLIGRIKELINRGGEKISPLEVDA